MANITNKLNKNTGENIQAVSVAQWTAPGSAPVTLTPANEATYLGGLYNKDASGYFKWNTAGDYPISRLTTVNVSNFSKLIKDSGTEHFTINIDRVVDLNGSSVTIPNNVILNFKGGSLKNGKIDSNGGTITFDTHAYVIFNNVELSGLFTGSLYLSQNSNTDDDICFNNITRFTTAYVDRDINLKKSYDVWVSSNRRLTRSIRIIGLNSAVITYSNNYLYSTYGSFPLMPHLAGSHHQIEYDGISIVDTDYDANTGLSSWTNVVPVINGSFSGTNSKVWLRNTKITTTGQCLSTGSADVAGYWQDVISTNCDLKSLVWPTVGTWNGGGTRANSRWRIVEFTNTKINNGSTIISSVYQDQPSESRCTWNSCELSGWFEYCSVGVNHAVISYINSTLKDYSTSNTNTSALPRSNDYIYDRCTLDGDWAHNGARNVTLRNTSIFQKKTNSELGNIELLTIEKSQIIFQGGFSTIRNTVKELSVKGLDIIHDDTLSGVPRLFLAPLKIANFANVFGSVKLNNKDYDFTKDGIIPKDVTDLNTVTRFNDLMSRNDLSIMESFIQGGTFTKKLSLNANTNVLIIQAVIDVKGRFFNSGTASDEGKVLLQAVINGVTYYYGLTASNGISISTGETTNLHNGTISAGKTLRLGIQTMTLYLSKTLLQVDIGGVTNSYFQYTNAFVQGTNLSDCTLTVTVSPNVVHISDVKILAL